MNAIDRLNQHLQNSGRHPHGFIPASEKDLKPLSNRLNISSERAVLHFQKNTPRSALDIFHVTILDPWGTIRANIHLSPGMYIFPLNYITFAIDDSGAAYCLDAESGSILKVNPDNFSGNTPESSVMVGIRDQNGAIVPNLHPTRPLVEKVATEKFHSYEDFIDDLIDSGNQ